MEKGKNEAKPRCIVKIDSTENYAIKTPLGMKSMKSGAISIGKRSVYFQSFKSLNQNYEI